MIDPQIKRKVDHAISRLLTDNSFLLVNDTYEVSLSSKLGTYLQDEFPNVDCEYNRHILSIKTLYSHKKFRPDIIIHQQGTDENNLLIIEMKKQNEPDNDLEILIATTIKGGEYGYDYGLFLAFERREDQWIPVQRWFQDGVEVS